MGERPRSGAIFWPDTKKSPLLTREQFRAAVLKRDGNKCVKCGQTFGITVHHIIDRKCFTDGGYYVDNGATVCEECHWNAEKGLFTTEQVRQAAKITTIVLPDGLIAGKKYDKWGRLL